MTLGLAVTTTSAPTGLVFAIRVTLTHAKATSLTKGLGLLLHLGQGLLKVLGLSLSPLRCLSNGSCPSGSKFESLSNSFANAFR